MKHHLAFGDYWLRDFQRASTYHLSGAEARAVIDHQIATIQDQWADVCERASLSTGDAGRLRNRQFLHPYAMEGY